MTNNNLSPLLLLSRYRFAVLLISLFVVISVIATSLMYKQYLDLKKYASASDKMTVSLLATLLLEHQKAAIGILQSYTSRSTFIEASRKKDIHSVLNHLEDLCKKNSEMDTAAVTDKSGVLWANYPIFLESRGKNFSYRDWYTGVSSQRAPYISTVYQQIIGKKALAVAVAVPVFDRKANVIGILVNAQRLHFLAEIIRQIDFKPHTRITVLDRAGNIIFSNQLPFEDQITACPSFPWLQKALEKGNDHIEFAESPHGRGQTFLTVKPITEIGWTVVAEHGRHDILREGFATMATTATTSLILFASLYLLILYLRKKLRLSEVEKNLEMESRLHEEERQQKQIEEKLLSSEKKYRHLFENMLDGIVHVDMDGFIILCNQGYQDMLGYSQDEIMKLTYVDVTPHKWHDFEKRIVEEQVIPEGHSGVYDKEYIKKDGTIFPVELRTYLVTDEQGLSEGMFAIVRDITHRKRAEENIRQLNASLEERVRERTAQLEFSNKELEAFSYSVSHDLRAPLRAIDGFSRILEEECQSKLGDEGKRLVDVVRSNTQQMGQLIDDILRLSRLGRQEIKPSVIDMAELARTVFRECESAAHQRALQLHMEQLPQVWGDKALMRQVFVNLISNATKFTGPRDVAIIEIGSLDKDGEHIYYVKDNGVGFDMQYSSKLFGVFQRLHSRKEFEGTGVGLAIVQRIINRHGGRVWAEGVVNEGATFFFSLPKQFIGKSMSIDGKLGERA